MKSFRCSTLHTAAFVKYGSRRGRGMSCNLSAIHIVTKNVGKNHNVGLSRHALWHITLLRSLSGLAGVRAK